MLKTCFVKRLSVAGALAGTLILAGLIYFYPRWLSRLMGEDHFLFSWFYIYFFGTLFFIFNMGLLLKSRALNLAKPGETKWFWFFTLALIWGMVLHGLWILMAVPLPFKGLPPGSG